MLIYVQEIVFSKQLTWMTHLPSMSYNRDGAFISLYLMTNAFANFFGPFIAGYVLNIKLDPKASPTELCVISTTDYINSGCEVTNISDWMAAMIAMVTFVLALNWVFESTIVNYCNEERNGVDKDTEFSQRA